MPDCCADRRWPRYLSEKDILLHKEERQRRPQGAARAICCSGLDRLTEARPAGFTAHIRLPGVDPHAARHVARIADDLLRQAGRILPRRCRGGRKR